MRGRVVGVSPAELGGLELRALGGAVRELRARRGFSQEELGYRGALHRNYVGAIERGEINPTFRVLLKLERGLSVPLSELVEIYERQRVAQLGIVPAAQAPELDHDSGAAQRHVSPLAVVRSPGSPAS